MSQLFGVSNKSRKKPTLRNYFKFAKKHPKKRGKLHALELIDKRADISRRLQEKAQQLKKEITIYDGKIRLTYFLLESLEKSLLILRKLSKIASVGQRSKPHSLKKKLEKLGDRVKLVIPYQIKETKDGEVIIDFPVTQGYMAMIKLNEKIRKLLKRTGYEHNIGFSLPKLCENIERWRMKLTKIGLQGVSLDTPFVDLPGLTDLMNKLAQFYEKTKNNCKAVRLGKYRWVAKIIRLSWTLPQSFSASVIEGRIYKQTYDRTVKQSSKK